MVTLHGIRRNEELRVLGLCPLVIRNNNDQKQLAQFCLEFCLQPKKLYIWAFSFSQIYTISLKLPTLQFTNHLKWQKPRVSFIHYNFQITTPRHFYAPWLMWYPNLISSGTAIKMLVPLSVVLNLSERLNGWK